MKEIFTSVCDKTGSVLVEFSGENDHVHLLVDYIQITIFQHLLVVSKRHLVEYYVRNFLTTCRKYIENPYFDQVLIMLYRVVAHQLKN